MQDVHRLGCRALAVDPLNRFLITGGADCLVKLWEISPVSLLSASPASARVLALQQAAADNTQHKLLHRHAEPKLPVLVPAPLAGCHDGISPCTQ